MTIDPDIRCNLAAKVVSKSIVAACMPELNRTCQNERVPTHPDVHPRSADRKTFFSGQGDACKSNLPFSGHIVKTFRRPTILQLNFKGRAARKMNFFHHLAVQHDPLVILPQETHCTSAKTLIILSFAFAEFSLSRKHSLATFVHERLKYTLLKAIST